MPFDNSLYPRPTGVTTALANNFSRWANQQFPNATQETRIIHLLKEVEELRWRIENGESLGEEIADCYSILGHIAWHADVNVQVELSKKLDINRKRRWKEDPDMPGLYSHVECSRDDCEMHPWYGLAPHEHDAGTHKTVFHSKSEWPDNFVGDEDSDLGGGMTEGMHYCPECKKGMPE